MSDEALTVERVKRTRDSIAANLASIKERRQTLLTEMTSKADELDVGTSPKAEATYKKLAVQVMRPLERQIKKTGDIYDNLGKVETLLERGEQEKAEKLYDACRRFAQGESV
ncbi:hypothetical protein [Haloglycomyces albus]|uniref:hypothetical protein n=1 Tax=Haloglycomyces albus TaxID=526067 RepID=UPI00046D6D32|nr:hypothetical protein [Haloglycomyces albus]